MMKNDDIYFFKPEKDYYIGDIPELNALYKESTTKLIFDAYSSLAKSFVNGGKH